MQYCYDSGVLSRPESVQHATTIPATFVEAREWTACGLNRHCVDYYGSINRGLRNGGNLSLTAIMISAEEQGGINGRVIVAGQPKEGISDRKSAIAFMEGFQGRVLCH